MYKLKFNRLFFTSLIVGRLLTLTFVSLTSKPTSDSLSPSDSSSSLPSSSSSVTKRRLIAQLFNRNTFPLTITLLTLLIVSFVQISSSHFSLNLKLLLWDAAATGSTTASLKTTTTSIPVQVLSTQDVRLNFYTIAVYGVIYPILLGSLIPQFFRLAEANRILVYSLRPSSLVNILFGALYLGFATQSLLNSYFIYAFKTPNAFIYANIFNSSFLILALVFYSRSHNYN